MRRRRSGEGRLAGERRAAGGERRRRTPAPSPVSEAPERGGPTADDEEPQGELLHGVRPVLEALEGATPLAKVWIAREGGGTTQRIEHLARAEGIPVKVVPREALDRKVGSGKRPPGSCSGTQRAVYADRVAWVDRACAQRSGASGASIGRHPGSRKSWSDPPVGSRAWCSGGWYSSDRSAPLNGGTVKASAGTAIHVPISRVVNLKHALDPLAAAGFWTAAAVLDGEPPHRTDLHRPIALIIGSEGKGVRPSLARKADIQLTIPMRPGTDSLNVSVAAGILIYEILRQRE